MLTHDDLPPHPFRAHDLLATGVSRKALDTAVRDGVARRVLRGAYVRGDLPDSVEVRARAAAQVTCPDSVLVDRTAAWLHGVDVTGWHEKEVLPPLESFVQRGHDRAQRLGVFGGTRDLREEDMMRLHGVVVTTPLRTALDLACVLPARDGLAAVDSFLHAGAVEKVDLRRLLPRYFRRRGVVQARRLVAWADAAAESPRESWTRFELLDRGLPKPVLQHWVEVNGVPTYRLDLAYPHHRIAIEYDGARHHTSAQDRWRDERRRGVLRDLGWIVIVVDGSSFVGEGVDTWVALVRTAMASRHSRTARTQARNWRVDA